MKTLLLFFLITIPYQVLSQTIKIGNIFDSNSNTPVSYATVCIIDTTIGTMADEKGYFELKIPNQLNEYTKVMISCLGYQSIILEFDTFKSESTFYLTQKNIELSEITVTYKKCVEKSYGVRQKNKHSSSVLTSGSTNLNLALFIPNNSHKEGFISEISYYILNDGVPDAPFRVRIYAKDENSNCPGKDILTKSLIVKGDPNGGWITICIDSLGIKFPKEGVFIGFEWLYDYTNYHYELKNSAGNIKDCYGQVVGLTNKYRKGQTWKKSIERQKWYMEKFNERYPLNMMANIKVKYYK